ncbi:MAG: acyltransferase [Caulobacter sp.]|nr:acyltransferase [Caulobacter sp.]
MSWLARTIRWWLVAFFKVQGWTVEGTAPSPRRFVIIAAPHTSNWDFVYFLGGADALNLNLSFMGKASLFRWPFARAMRDLGGIPIDRTRANDVVSAMAEEFARREEFMLTIAPEGTRGRARKWKTGFYQIALKAQVPMVCGMMDYRRKVVGLGPAIMPSGDYDRDMLEIARFYSACTPRHPEQATDLTA